VKFSGFLTLKIEEGLTKIRPRSYKVASMCAQFKLSCDMRAVFYGTCPVYLTNIVESIGAGRTRSSLRSTTERLNTTEHKVRSRHMERIAWRSASCGRSSEIQKSKV